MKIKICGLRRREDIAFVNVCRPDYIGFVFAPSRRRVDLETAAALKRELAPGILAVGVFVNQESDFIGELWRRGIIHMAQLHGDEDEGEIRRVKALGPPVIKAVRVGQSLPPLPQSADYLLFDAYDAKERGGTGKAFDWGLAAEVGQPYFLAGGIDMGNVDRALETLTPHCVDVSSGVETDGVKDGEKITAMVRKIRSCT